MSHSVVHSGRYGSRPLLEVSPMSISNQNSLEVPTLENAHPGYNPGMPHRGAHNPMYGAGVYQGMPATVPDPVSWPHPGYDTRYSNTAPAGYYPSNNYHPPASYPGVANPYGYTYPAPVHGPIPRIVNDPSFNPTHPGFNIKCDLEFGRIININVRDSAGAFRGIPPFLRDELVRTYGRYPYTQVKVRMEGGEFHIYASAHDKSQGRGRGRRRREDDAYSDTYYEAHSERFRGGDNDYDSDSDGISPRDPRDRPRLINHEPGWNHYR